MLKYVSMSAPSLFMESVDFVIVIVYDSDLFRSFLILSRCSTLSRMCRTQRYSRYWYDVQLYIHNYMWLIIFEVANNRRNPHRFIVNFHGLNFIAALQW